MKNAMVCLGLVLSATASATTCFENKDQVAALSEKYRDQVLIEVAKDEYAVDVAIRFPTTIEGKNFSGATLIRGDINSRDFDFAMPLQANESEGRMLIWYVVHEALFKNTTIELSYSQSCGPVIRYKVT